MYIKQTNSTNTLLRELITRGEKVTFVRTDNQTNGRGQAGNSWESEEGKNLLCSVFIQPTNITVEQQFEINIMVANAVHKIVAEACHTHSEKVTIKWPNDIYVANKKIAGILIENALSGQKIEWTIAGIGLNVNQTQWLSNAPNPVSIKQITDQETDIETIMNKLIESIQQLTSWSKEQQWHYYRQHLYRREGYWPFVEREVSAAPTMIANKTKKNQFVARIDNITPQGEIVLIDTDNQQRKYHFKQIRFVI